jgi:hypothetical protein
MLLDAQLQFSAAQAITVDAVSTNIIDLGTARQIGVGEPMGILITVDVAADATTGDETYAIQLQTDDNSSFSSQTTLFAQDIPRARLTIGSRHFIPLPLANVERYIRLNYDVGGTTPTLTLSSWLHPANMIDVNYQYPVAYTVQ